MNCNKRILQLLFFIMLVTWQDVAVAQVVDSTNLVVTDDSAIPLNEKGKLARNNFSKLRWRPYVMPAALFTYGLVTPSIKALRKVDVNIRQKIVLDKPHNNTTIDDYLQYTPALAVYGLNLVGDKGKNNLRDRTLILLMSQIFAGTSTKVIKYISKRMRPDGSENNSFISGHTAEVFANATFLFYEYRHKSVWYGVAGYAVAAVTGYLRMYNDKHWLSDVIAGAAVGITSTNLAYWFYPKISKHLFKVKNTNTAFIPSYNRGNFSMNFVKWF